MRWKKAGLACASLMLVACAGHRDGATAQTEDSVTDFSTLLANKSILFFGAHPDDETVSIAMMAEACLHNNAACHFAVISDYKSYGCYLTIGLSDPHECSRLRKEEMLTSAALVGGSVEFYGWEEYFFAHDQAGLQRNLARWADDNGGRTALLTRILETLETTSADVVIALDPRHGSSCHPNHRAATLLLMEALETLPAERRPDVFFESNFYITAHMDEETLAGFMGGGIYPWPGDDAPIHWYDASKILPDGQQAYDYIVASLKAHATQFPEIADGSTTPAPPDSLKRAPYVKPADIDIAADFCTPLELNYPTFDVTGFPPNYGDAPPPG